MQSPRPYAGPQAALATAPSEIVTTGIWSGDAGSMTTFFTSSEQVVEASAEYYYNVYSYNPQISSSAEAIIIS